MTVHMGYTKTNQKLSTALYIKNGHKNVVKIMRQEIVIKYGQTEEC